MPCPTCDHTMQNVGVTCDQDGARVFWCPRCGTLRTEGRFHGDDAPKLVERCRKFGETLVGDCAEHLYQWEVLGIREAINVPKDRPPID